MRAIDLMTPNPRVVTGNQSVRDATVIMREQNVGLVPVVDDRAHMHPRGVITDRDIAVRCVAEGHGPDRPLESFMTTGHLHSVAPDASVEEVLATMEDAQIRRLLVVENGRLVGIIAQADLALKEGNRAPLQVEEMLERVSSPAPGLA